MEGDATTENPKARSTPPQMEKSPPLKQPFQLSTWVKTAKRRANRYREGNTCNDQSFLDTHLPASYSYDGKNCTTHRLAQPGELV